jgi:hypothetical protein
MKIGLRHFFDIFKFSFVYLSPFVPLSTNVERGNRG